MFRRYSNLLKCSNVFKALQVRSQSKSIIQIFINGTPVKVPSYFTIMQALRKERITIPSFCYHERLSIVGNCRMCLIEVEGSWKPQIACSLQVQKDMKIHTNSEMTQRAQESVLEFILVNHPLDCPICDQGGECDLQDLSMRFGNDRSRFTDVHFEGKRAQEDKNLGPLIRTEMTRCIQCTRCIRFGAQVCGLEVLGSTGRGNDMLIGTYVDKMFLSELSGNVIDLCPVGALTSIPYMFKARPWEVRRVNSIDVMDATGTNIELSCRFNRVLRVLPREHDEINQEWVSDKGRWAIDSLEMQRLVTPMNSVDGNNLVPVEWDYALKRAATKICSVPPDQVVAVAGPYCNVETLVVAKDFLNSLGCENTYIERNMNYSMSGIDLRAAYSLNVKMQDVAQADKIILVGTNPRFEAPILNAWIRMAYRSNECDIYVVGPTCDYNYYVNYLGDDVSNTTIITEILKGAKKPLIFVGVSLLGKDEANAVMNVLATIAAKSCCIPNWSVLNIVTTEASFAGALEAGWKPGALDALNNNPKVLISLGADDIFYHWKPPQDCKVIYVGFQGDRGAQCAAVVLPGSAYTESGGIYLNMEGRAQRAYPGVTPPGKARSDWKIMRALAEYCGVNLFYSDEDSLRCRLEQISPNFVNLGPYQTKLFSDLLKSTVNKAANKGGKISVDMICLKDYYCSDIFTYNSLTMLKAQKAACDYETSAYARN